VREGGSGRWSVKIGREEEWKEKGKGKGMEKGEWERKEKGD
jgi:hypothetical protein